MKKLSFLVPAYNGLSWLQKNVKFWSEVTKYVDVILVEDSSEKQMEQFCKKHNITYYSKPNGNWGSVINFAIKNRLIKTEWMAIVDVDDTVKISQLATLIESLDSRYDVIYTHSDNIDFATSKSLYITTNKWVHSSWIKTSLFNSVDKLPENVFYMDSFFMAFIKNSKNFKTIDSLIPYNYFINIPNQSINISTVSMLKQKMSSLLAIENEFENYVLKNNLSITRDFLDDQKHAVSMSVRNLYEKSSLKSDLVDLKNIYKENYRNKRVSLKKRLFWAILYRIFTFKKAVK